VLGGHDVSVPKQTWRWGLWLLLMLLIPVRRCRSVIVTMLLAVAARGYCGGYCDWLPPVVDRRHLSCSCKYA